MSRRVVFSCIDPMGFFWPMGLARLSRLTITRCVVFCNAVLNSVFSFVVSLPMFSLISHCMSFLGRAVCFLSKNGSRML